MSSTLNLEDCLLPLQADPWAAAGYVQRRTNVSTIAKEPPKSRKKAAATKAPKDGSSKKLGASNCGDEDSDDDDGRKRGVSRYAESDVTLAMLKSKEKSVLNGNDTVMLSNYFENDVLFEAWQHTQSDRELCRARRNKRESTLISKAPEVWEATLKRNDINHDSAKLAIHLLDMKLRRLRQAIEITLLADVESKVIARLKTSDFFLPRIMRIELASHQHSSTANANTSNRRRRTSRYLLAHIMETVLRAPDGWWYVALEALDRLISICEIDQLQVGEYLQKMRTLALSKNNLAAQQQKWSGFHFSELSSLQPLLESELAIQKEAILVLYHDFISLEGNLHILVFLKDQPFALQRLISNEEPPKFGWYKSQGPRHRGEEAFWRYRIGTLSGDDSYIFKVQLNEEVIGMWTPDGDIDWSEELEQEMEGKSANAARKKIERA